MLLGERSPDTNFSYSKSAPDPANRTTTAAWEPTSDTLALGHGAEYVVEKFIGMTVADNGWSSVISFGIVHISSLNQF